MLPNIKYKFEGSAHDDLINNYYMKRLKTSSNHKSCHDDIYIKYIMRSSAYQVSWFNLITPRNRKQLYVLVVCCTM